MTNNIILPPMKRFANLTLEQIAELEKTKFATMIDYGFNKRYFALIEDKHLYMKHINEDKKFVYKHLADVNLGDL